MQDNKNRKIKVIKKVLLLLFLGSIYLILVNVFHLGFKCVFHEVTGLLCPGCGITRCISCMLKGDFTQAFHYNALMFFLVPLAIIYTIYVSYNYIKGNKYYKLSNRVTYILLIIVLLFGIIRNII